MAVIIGGTSGDAAGVGAEAASPLHVVTKPLPYGSLGHYRTTVKIVMATSQAANSRLFEVRNTHASNLIVLTRCFVMASAAGTVTTSYLGEWGLWKVTGFTAVDNTNVSTPTSSVKRTTGMAAYPGGAAVRYSNGNAAGMTGGTLTKDANMAASVLVPAITLAGAVAPYGRELVDDMNGTHPFVFAQNEGFIVENIVAGSATANVVHVVIDVSWAEVTAF